MEEIDSIIIETLKNLNCDLPEEITSLKDFDADTTILALSTCLEAVVPNSSFLKKLPPSMSLKLKLGSQLAQQIKELGYHDDVGYQTILYCNEAEIRRLLMFLIEKLPRESSHFDEGHQELRYVPRIVNEIELRIKNALESMWLPSNILRKGTRDRGEYFDVSSFGESSNLEAVGLKVPRTSNVVSDAEKLYNVRVIPEVTKQCNKNQLLPSLLFNDCKVNNFSKDEIKNLLSALDRPAISDSPIKKSELSLIKPSTNDIKLEANANEDIQNKIQELLLAINNKTEEFNNLKESIAECSTKLESTKEQKDLLENNLKETIQSIKVKTKTLAVLNDEEKYNKLKTIVDSGEDRLKDLETQWRQVADPLWEEYNTLKSTHSESDLKYQEDQTRLKNIKINFTSLMNDYKEKEILEDILKKKLLQASKSNPRSSYTKRILEIIANIKKQDIEIQKVLKDTKVVQKEINNLGGQVDRSFALSDEIIFKNAKHDEMSRKAYKFLASFRDEFSDIIKTVSDLGLIERENRNLQEQFDIESGKETSQKLDRVNKDIQEMSKEIELLKSGQ